MSTLPNPDANDIGRYDGTVGIPADPVDGFPDYQNLAIDDISAAISRIKAENTDYDTGAPTLAAGWNTPSQHILRRRNGIVIYRFNAFRTAALAANGVIADIPAGFRTNSITWFVAHNATTGDPILIWYDPATHQIKSRTTIPDAEAIALSSMWEAVS